LGIDNGDDAPDDDAPVDPATVRRAQRGDAWALDALVRALEPYLGRICGAIAADAGDDALQEAMIAVIRNIGALREPAALRGWARRIAVREAVRATRTARAGDGRVVPVDPARVLAQVPALRDDAGAVEVRAVLDGLGPEQRAVLVLRHLGAGEQEMAEALGVAPGTVKSRLSRARAAFREQWSS
jgi:RNA polymerase sigma factor (sigma-70 family)